jgi:CHASE2 domain-containing sensor protein
MTFEVIDGAPRREEARDRQQPGSIPMKTIQPAPFLRQALLADAVTSAACAVLMIAAAGFLEGLLGLPAALLRGAGLVLLPFVACLAVLATRESVPRAAVWAVIGANALWAVESALLLLTGWVDPTPAGIVFVIAQGAVVALYAELQIVGLRRSAALAA